ncbi:MAG: cyclic nucleotide-binding domain-containing protein [Deltaproteobacteria bacterium]|jgi:hypothetical protein|nr:cyclic nucleotide-binding domain-containing protein [Deltaproteobacteria bacterium]MBT6434813.1 cyclic nucleotide-binding domain-containing protein [Deltaproteobacteria bacterium]MBT6492252.1 cyclic nucleotide-binding domain-containing protein [Deltaproteobacteria bacterium]
MLPELELSTAAEKRQAGIKRLGSSLGLALSDAGPKHETKAGQELTSLLEDNWVYLSEGYLKATLEGSTLCIISPKEFFRVPADCAAQKLQVIGDFAATLTVLSDQALSKALVKNESHLNQYIRFQSLYVDALESLCADLAGGEIRPALRFAVFQPGDIILEEGSPATNVGVMTRGHAVVKVDDAVVGEIHSGELFGEMSFLTGESRAASVEATKICECQFTTHQDFARLIQARPSLMIDVASQMARRISELDTRHAKA